MSRHKKAWKPEGDEPTLDISSLIDVCFLLLIYFIVTTQLVPQEQDLNLAIPSGAPSSDVAKAEPLLISISKDGTVSEGIGASMMPLSSDPKDDIMPAVYERLNSFRQQGEALGNTPVLQLYVENGAMHQRVSETLAAVRRAGINTITFTDIAND